MAHRIYSADDIQTLEALASKMGRELEEDILPFWKPFQDAEGGGFYGLIRNDLSVDKKAPKGLVMHSRFLSAYSAAYEKSRNPEHLALAKAACDYLTTALHDTDMGGFWWIVDSEGTPERTEKVIYGQAFAIYGLSRYYLACGDKKALDLALETFHLIERGARDRKDGGYGEASDRGFSKSLRFALSEVDIACDKSMNTNLHVIEAYAALLTASGNLEVKEALRALLEIYATKVFQPDGHLALYFEKDWKSLTDHVSWGHDIESCWLLVEAGEIAFDHTLPGWLEAPISQAEKTALRELLEFESPLGLSMPHEKHNGHVDSQRDWWVQAEAIVGFVNAWERSGDRAYLRAATGLWDWIETYQKDLEHGEWFWGVTEEGRPVDQPKGGLWKTCYHNGRACLEVLARCERVVHAGSQETR